MPNIGPMELIVVLVIALVVLGPKRLPQAGQSLGKGIRDFKHALTGDAEPGPADRISETTSDRTAQHSA